MSKILQPAADESFKAAVAKEKAPKIPNPGFEIELFGDLMLVLRDIPKDREGNIYLPSAAQMIPNTGVILGVGPGRRVEKIAEEVIVPMKCKVGNRVMFHMHSLQPVDMLDPDKEMWYGLLREQDVWAIVKSEAKK